MSDNKANIDLDSIIENKLKENLQWSMVFVIFNYISSDIDSKSKDSPNIKSNFSGNFFKNWKKHMCQHVIKKDLETIHSILNSPKNIFLSSLQNSGEIIESTEIYQEKYNNILKKIEEFYNSNMAGNQNNND